MGILFRRLLLALLLLSALGAAAPVAAQGRGPEWVERRTAAFAILYIAGSEAEAARYEAFADGIYDEVSAVFAQRTATPVTLRLYPTMELYYQANPQARNVPGVVAHANSGRREISVAVPQTARQNEEQIQNNVRHELTHLVIADISNDRLNAFFHEGVAQYVEHASTELDDKIVLLKQAIDQGQLLRWRDFEDRDVVYGQPGLSYPQSLSVVAFLVERFGFPALREFLLTYSRSSGYRSALERAYKESPDQLEAQWRDWLPSYVEGGYRRNALTAYDLSHIEALLAQGRYDDALTGLKDAIEWLGKTEQRDVLARAEALRDKGIGGQQAQQKALDARAALERAEYEQALALVQQARQAYDAVGDTRQREVLDAYEARAEQGAAATRQLEEAGRQAGALRYPQARAILDEASGQFQALGDAARAAQAQALRQQLDGRQALLGYGVLLLGLLGVLLSVWQRLSSKRGEVW